MGYLRWLGHAAFELELMGKRILIDPWISNPNSPITLGEIDRVDFILVTHDHSDHLGETAQIASKTNATVVAIFELATYLAEREGVKNTVGMNIGGSAKLTNEIEVYMTPAIHSSTHGSPAGFVIKSPEATIYHAGDTGIFGDMELIGRLYKPDIALLPIGGFFTMSPREAAYAAALINPRAVVPMHYNTFPQIRQDPEEFRNLVESLAPHIRVYVMKPGDRLELPLR